MLSYRITVYRLLLTILTINIFYTTRLFTSSTSFELIIFLSLVEGLKLVRAAPTLLNPVDVCVWYNVRKSGCEQGDSFISNNPYISYIY